MKLLRYGALGVTALGIGWFIGGVAIITAMGHLLEPDWDDEGDGGFMPDQVLARARDIRNGKIFEAIERWDEAA